MSTEVIYDSLEHQAALRRFNHYENVDKCLEHLLGICTGLTADQHITDEEIVFLHHWLMDHPILEKVWPASELLELTTRILDDNVIEEAERTEISELLNKVIGSPIENGVASGMATESPLDENANVIIPDHTFIFTGKFTFGSRKKCEDIVKEMGGKIGGKDVSLRTSYLVIGGTASEHWKFSSFGRKIQKAIDVRNDDRSNLKIISEQQWLDAISNVSS